MHFQSISGFNSVPQHHSVQRDKMGLNNKLSLNKVSVAYPRNREKC